MPANGKYPENPASPLPLPSKLLHSEGIERGPVTLFVRIRFDRALLGQIHSLFFSGRGEVSVVSLTLSACRAMTGNMDHDMDGRAIWV